MREVFIGPLASSVHCNPSYVALNDITNRGLHSAKVIYILEPAVVDRGDCKTLNGITRFPFYKERSLCWDGICVREHAARVADGRKRRKYGALEARFRFEPVTIKAAGVYVVHS